VGGAALLAGVAGMAAAETVTAPDAGATAGNPAVMGNANDSGTTPTSLTSAAAGGATLAVANTAGQAPLNLVQEPIPSTWPPPLASGDLANYGGDLYYATGTTGASFIGFVYTAQTANQLVTIKPHRILDTRTAAGRAHITNPTGNLDSAGRLLGTHTIVISLSSLEVAAVAAYCNLTVVTPLNGGNMVLFPGGTRPATSSINFVAHVTVANFALTGTTSTLTTDTVSIFSTATTHVLLDITGFTVWNPGQVNPAVLAEPARTATRQRLAARAEAGSLPGWYTAR